MTRLGMMLLAAMGALVSVVAAFNSMSVTRPAALRDKLSGNGNVEEQPAWFGTPTYGRALRGQVYWPDVSDRKACGPMKSAPSNELKNPWVYMVNRGDCTFVTKVRNAQNAGAAAVIVIDSENTNGLPRMSDDGSGASIAIPSLIIKKIDGDIISDFIGRNSNVPIEVSIEYGLPQSAETVDYTLWTSSMDTQANEFKQNFVPIATTLDNRASFQVRYFFVNGKSYGCNTQPDTCGNQCTNNGRYCAVDPDRDLLSGISGADVVQENLRQICIFKVSKDARKPYMWWSYVNAHREKCISANTVTKACSDGAISTVDGLSQSDVDKCVHASFGADQHKDTPNTLIEYELEQKNEEGVYLLPTMLINNTTFYGSLSCPQPLDMTHCPVFKTICSAYVDGKQPSICLPSKGCELGKTRDVCDRCLAPESPAFITDPSKCVMHNGGVSVGTVIALIVVFVAILVGAAFVYHRHSSTQMRDELRNIMSQYVPLEGDSLDRARLVPSARD